MTIKRTVVLTVALLCALSPVCFAKRLPDIPTCASPYSDYAPYLCYPGSDNYYSFPGIRDPWVFNRAMVWLEQKDGVDGPPICYSGGDSLWLS
jgi:hypothetical protein